MRVKCFTQEYNTMTRPGLEPGPLDPESSALTTRPPRLPHSLKEIPLIVSLALKAQVPNVLQVSDSITFR